MSVAAFAFLVSLLLHANVELESQMFVEGDT